MYKMFLDDIRTPIGPGFVVVRSYDEACAYVREHGFPSFVSFDNDLGTEMEGYDFAKFLVDADLDAKFGGMPDDFSYCVHSANPVAHGNINGIMRSYLNFRKEYKRHFS